MIEAGSLSKEVRRISRAFRLTIALRRRLAARDVAAFLAFALPPSSEAFARLAALVPKVLLLWDWILGYMFSLPANYKTYSIVIRRTR